MRGGNTAILDAARNTPSAIRRFILCFSYPSVGISDANRFYRRRLVMLN